MTDTYNDPLPGKTYVSPSLDAFNQPGRKVRIATKAIEHPQSYAFAEIKGELVLRHKENAKSCITAKFFEDDRGLFVLSIQGYTVATGKPHNASFSFIGDEISKLVEFINHIQTIPLKHTGARKISDAELRRVILSNPQVRLLLEDNKELFAEVLHSSLTKEDVVAVGYRKQQLEVFRRLLEEPDYFSAAQAKRSVSPEALWQRFFEKNPWIFGHGLRFVYLSGLDDKKLEQVVHGYSVSERGKRIDALLKSRGLISNLCFVEIKTHKTSLLNKEPYRVGCWAPSHELSGAVSQVQGTVDLAADSIKKKLSVTDEAGDPTGEEIFNYMPSSFLVVGSLHEFAGEHGVNQERFRSFELYRRNLSAPEIITFDELFERARFIVKLSES